MDAARRGKAAAKPRQRIPGSRPRPSSGLRVAAAGPDPAGAGDGALGRAARHYAEAVLGGDARGLGRIQERFEEFPMLPWRDRMVLASAYERFLGCGDESARARHAADAFSAVKKLDPPAFSRYFGAIKDHVGPYMEAAEALRQGPGRPPDLFRAWLSTFPLEIGPRMFGALLDSYGRGAAPAEAGGGGRPAGD